MARWHHPSARRHCPSFSQQCQLNPLIPWLRQFIVFLRNWRWSLTAKWLIGTRAKSKQNRTCNASSNASIIERVNLQREEHVIERIRALVSFINGIWRYDSKRDRYLTIGDQRASLEESFLEEKASLLRERRWRNALNQMRSDLAANYPPHQHDHERHMFEQGGNIYRVLLGHILVQHINSLAGKPFILHFSLYGASPNPMG